MTEKNNPWDIFKNGADGSDSHLKRSGGILMPVFSLPSPHGIGTFGAAAYKFADFLAASGQSYWQVLPLNPTGFCTGWRAFPGRGQPAFLQGLPWRR